MSDIPFILIHFTTFICCCWLSFKFLPPVGQLQQFHSLFFPPMSRRRFLSFSIRLVIVLLIVLPFSMSSITKKVSNLLQNQSLSVSTSSSIVNTSSASPLPSSASPFVFALSSISILGVPKATVSVDCRTQQLINNIQSLKWECGIEEEKNAGRRDQWGQKGDNWKSLAGENDESATNGSRKQLTLHKWQFRSGPIELYHSNKVNQSDGTLYISTLLRWQFSPLLPKNFYRIHLWIGQNDWSNASDADRHFVVSLALSDSNFPSMTTTKGHRAELFLRIDAFFQFGHSYDLLCLAKTFNRFPPMKNENGTTETNSFLGSARRTISFHKMYDEFDNDGCPNDRGFTLNPKTSAEQLAKRREMASRWTGALHSISFFPLHFAVKVRFFGAAPSLCIGTYRVQLWLFNSLQNETIVKSDQLSRIGPNIFIGSAEFRDLLMDERMKYQVKVVPMEQTNGVCVCQLNGKCGCVQVHSEPFSLMLYPNWSSAADQFDFVSLMRPSALSFSVPSSPSHSFPPLPLLLVCLFLSLMLILLGIALLLLIIRRSDRSAERKRHILITFKGSNKRRKSGEGFGESFSLHGPQKKLESVLLVNGQPKRRNELERFARVLVKNGIRVFYDRWDRESIERNLLGWVQNAVKKSNKIVLFYDSRAEQLIVSSAANGQNGDLFDRVFCALYQHLEAQKTIFIKWDESKLMDGRPLNALLLSENVFLFQRDLKHIFTVLDVTISDTEQRDIEREYEKAKVSLNLTAILKREEKPNERTLLLSPFDSEEGTELNERHHRLDHSPSFFPNGTATEAAREKAPTTGEVETITSSNCNTTTQTKWEWRNELKEQTTKNSPMVKEKEENDSGVIVP